METSNTIARITEALSGVFYSYQNEREIHEGIREALFACGLSPNHEVISSPRSRFDFLVSGIVIEVKVGGTYEAALKQCRRYAGRPEVRGVILASTCEWADIEDPPDELNEKPFELVALI